MTLSILLHYLQYKYISLYWTGRFFSSDSQISHRLSTHSYCRSLNCSFTVKYLNIRYVTVLPGVRICPEYDSTRKKIIRDRGIKLVLFSMCRSPERKCLMIPAGRCIYKFTWWYTSCWCWPFTTTCLNARWYVSVT